MLPDLRGFAYCDRVKNIVNLPFQERLNGLCTRSTAHDRRNVEPIRQQYVFERDEYVHLFRFYTLVSLSGV